QRQQERRLRTFRSFRLWRTCRNVKSLWRPGNRARPPSLNPCQKKSYDGSGPAYPSRIQFTASPHHQGEQQREERTRVSGGRETLCLFVKLVQAVDIDPGSGYSADASLDLFQEVVHVPLGAQAAFHHHRPLKL